MLVMYNNRIESLVHEGLWMSEGLRYSICDKSGKVVLVAVLGSNLKWGMEDGDNNLIIPCENVTFNSDYVSQGVILMGSQAIIVKDTDSETWFEEIMNASFADYMKLGWFATWGVYDLKGKRLKPSEYKQARFDNTVADYTSEITDAREYVK